MAYAQAPHESGGARRKVVDEAPPFDSSLVVGGGASESWVTGHVTTPVACFAEAEPVDRLKRARTVSLLEELRRLLHRIPRAVVVSQPAKRLLASEV